MTQNDSGVARSMLDGLSAIAAQSFGSSAAATEAILQMIARHVGMRSSFLSHIDPGTGRKEIFAAFNAPDGCGMMPGRVFELPQTY